MDATSLSLGTMREQERAGKLRYLVNYSDHRYGYLPDLPSIAEAGFPEAAKLRSFAGIYTHRNTPEEIKAYLTNLSKKIYDDPRFKKGFEKLEEEPVFIGPDQMREMVKKAEEVAVPLLKELGLYVGK